MKVVVSGISADLKEDASAIKIWRALEGLAQVCLWSVYCSNDDIYFTMERVNNVSSVRGHNVLTQIKDVFSVILTGWCKVIVPILAA